MNIGAGVMVPLGVCVRWSRNEVSMHWRRIGLVALFELEPAGGSRVSLFVTNLIDGSLGWTRSIKGMLRWRSSATSAPPTLREVGVAIS